QEIINRDRQDIQDRKEIVFILSILSIPVNYFRGNEHPPATADGSDLPSVALGHRRRGGPSASFAPPLRIPCWARRAHAPRLESKLQSELDVARRARRRQRPEGGVGEVDIHVAEVRPVEGVEDVGL